MWAIGALAYGITVLQRTSFGVAGLQAAERFSIGPSLLSVFVFMQLLVYALCQVPVGLALDRFGARRVLAFGALTVAVGQSVLAIAQSLPLAFLGRGIVGLGDAATFISAIRLINFWFPSGRVAFMTQMTQMFGNSFQVISALPFAALLVSEGWTTSFLTLGTVGVLMFVLVASATQNSPADMQHDPTSLTQREIIAALKESWSHPGTRLGFWTHFVTPFSSMTWAFLWGVPFLIKAQGLTQIQAGQVLSTSVLLGIAIGPVIGFLVSRYPLRRSRITLTIVAIMSSAWTVLLLQSHPVPRWTLFIFAAALAFGGPGSMIGLDHARYWNPLSRLGAAQGLVNGAGFFAAVISIFSVGFVLQIAGDYSLNSFRIAFLVQYPLWIIGVTQILRYRRQVKVLRAEQEIVD